MTQRKRRQFSPELKYKIVKEGLQTNVRISELCRHYDIYPVDYYRWKKNAEAAILNDFKKSKRKEKKLTPKEQRLQDEIDRLQAVIVQLTKEHVELKKKSTDRSKKAFQRTGEKRDFVICDAYEKPDSNTGYKGD